MGTCLSKRVGDAYVAAIIAGCNASVAQSESNVRDLLVTVAEQTDARRVAEEACKAAKRAQSVAEEACQAAEHAQSVAEARWASATAEFNDAMNIVTAMQEDSTDLNDLRSIITAMQEEDSTSPHAHAHAQAHAQAHAHAHVPQIKDCLVCRYESTGKRVAIVPCGHIICADCYANPLLNNKEKCYLCSTPVSKYMPLFEP